MFRVTATKTSVHELYISMQNHAEVCRIQQKPKGYGLMHLQKVIKR